MTDSDSSADRVAAVLTAFRPDSRLVDVVQSALAQCLGVVVVDNTPMGGVTARELLGSQPNVVVIESRENLGLASALNRGVAETGESEFILFLDQDSVLERDVVSRLQELLDAEPTRGIAAPAPWDAEADRYLDPRTALRPMVSTMPVVITSGMLMRRRAWRQTQGMREDFFVDCVDQDICLQVRRAGWSIVQDRSVLLRHTLGEATWHGFWVFRLRATHHPTWRLYWVARNGVILSRENMRFDPRWSFVNLAILGYWLLTVLLVEPPRFMRMRTMLHGIEDGIRRRRDARFLPGAQS